MLSNAILGSLAGLSLALILWQWLAGARFPLHHRGRNAAGAPGITLLKPLKGADAFTEECLRSWFAQDYAGPVQILFAVASSEDRACEIVRRLLKEFPHTDAELVTCGPLAGVNAKVAKLAQLEPRLKHEIVVVSDADVRVPPDLLTELAGPLADPQTGLVNCLYRLANPANTAMCWEAVAVNADFWSQVLQARTLKPIDFALGAVMAFPRAQLTATGGFEALRDCLADDYQLGHRIARLGKTIALSPVVVDCLSDPMTWGAVWKHQLRWARTIRVCQPVPYFFSILGNGTLWPLLWCLALPSRVSLGFAAVTLVTRVLTALHLESRLSREPVPLGRAWLPLLKDVLQAVIWILAFAGNRVEWRGRRLRLKRDGTLAEG